MYILLLFTTYAVYYVTSIQIALYTSYPGRFPESRQTFAPQRNATLAPAQPKNFMMPDVRCLWPMGSVQHDRHCIHRKCLHARRRIVDCKPLASLGGVLQGLTRMDLNIKEPSFLWDIADIANMFGFVWKWVIYMDLPFTYGRFELSGQLLFCESLGYPPFKHTLMIPELH